MKTILKHLAFSAFLILSFSACQTPIDLELPDNEPELVIEAYLTDLDFFIPEQDLDCSGLFTIPKSQIELAAGLAAQFPIDSIESVADYFPFNKVKLSSTANYFSSGPAPAVSDALVRLFKNDELVETLVEDQDTPGTYRITHDPEVGASYRLEIEALGNFYETDPQVYNSVPPLLGANAIYKPNFLQDSCAYYLGIDTYEKPGLGDNYRWFFYINNEYVSDPFFLSIFDDSQIDGLCLFEFDVYGNELRLGDTIVVFQMRTNEGYTNFVNSLRNQTAFVGGPFDTPPAPIRGNLRNLTTDKEAFGFFVAGGISANAGFVPEEKPVDGCGID
jgi:hypothetical protein